MNRKHLILIVGGVVAVLALAVVTKKVNISSIQNKLNIKPVAGVQPSTASKTSTVATPAPTPSFLGTKNNVDFMPVTSQTELVTPVGV